MYDSILYNLMELYPGVINFKLITLQIMLIIDNHTAITHMGQIVGHVSMAYYWTFYFSTYNQAFILEEPNLLLWNIV